MVSFLIRLRLSFIKEDDDDKNMGDVECTKGLDVCIGKLLLLLLLLFVLDVEISEPFFSYLTKIK